MVFKILGRFYLSSKDKESQREGTISAAREGKAEGPISWTFGH